MGLLYIMRHCESDANRQNILAGQNDFPLSEQGQLDAAEIAEKFTQKIKIDTIISSPLKRASQTAAAFTQKSGVQPLFDKRLIEQHLGSFSGMTYDQLQTAQGYEHDKTKRWKWLPAGGGESYEIIASRVRDFFANRKELTGTQTVLITCHAVVMRLIKMVLEKKDPHYPIDLAKNGEIWKTEYQGLETKHSLQSIYLIDNKRYDE